MRSSVSECEIAVRNDPMPYPTQPIMNTRLRPMMAPIFPPVIMKAAMTSVYSVMAD
jgi:hypothetical protein